MPQGRVLVCATASAHEGDETYDGWANKGLEHYGTLGIAAEVLALKTREDAHRDEVVAKLYADYCDKAGFAPTAKPGKASKAAPK